MYHYALKYNVNIKFTNTHDIIYLWDFLMNNNDFEQVSQRVFEDPKKNLASMKIYHFFVFFLLVVSSFCFLDSSFLLQVDSSQFRMSCSC
jgi:hypothetical protein